MLNKRLTKKVTTITITGILTAGMSVAAFASPGGGAPGAPDYPMETGEAVLTTSDMQESEQPPAPPAMDQQRMAPPANMQDGEEPPEKPEGDEAPEKPDGDEATERPEVPEIKDGEQPVRPKDGEFRPVMINTDAVGEVIEAIEDEDTASSLSGLLSAYTAAMDAEKEALDSEDTDEETLAALREASEEARTALIEALTEAGIDAAEYTDVEKLLDRPENESGELAPPEKPEGDETIDAEDELPEIPVLEDKSSSDNKGGIIYKAKTTLKNAMNSVGNWFSGIFKK